MRLEQNPVFRNVIVPWYDSETACFIMIFVVGLISLFALTGLSVALNHPIYYPFRWVPMLLLVMCGGVILSVSARLLKRYLQRFSK